MKELEVDIEEEGRERKNFLLCKDERIKGKKEERRKKRRKIVAAVVVALWWDNGKIFKFGDMQFQFLFKEVFFRSLIFSLPF